MPDVIIEIEGLDRVQRKLEALEPRRLMSDVMGQCLADIKDDVAQAPGPGHSPVVWASERQRRWYFWARRRAGLPFKYARESDPWSAHLMGGWTTRVEQGGMRGVVGSRTGQGGRPGYGPFVMDESLQQPMHKATGWQTIQQVAKRQAPKAIKRIQAAIRKILRS